MSPIEFRYSRYKGYKLPIISISVKRNDWKIHRRSIRSWRKWKNGESAS